jgi:hypothetical protein
MLFYLDKNEVTWIPFCNWKEVTGYLHWPEALASPLPGFVASPYPLFPLTSLLRDSKLTQTARCSEQLLSSQHDNGHTATM